MTEKKSKFLKTFFKERKQVGAVAPSSRFLVKKMLNKIDFDTADILIELGPGTGVFTKEILKRAKPNTKIFVFELNEDFYNSLKRQFTDERLIIVNESAESMQKVLKEYNCNEADAIISSLPLTVIPMPIKGRIIHAAHDILKTNGIYVQYQYSLNAKSLLERYFGPLNLKFTLINIPPAFIYVAKKKD